MTVSNINAKAFSALSALNGRTLSTLSHVNGQAINAPFGAPPSSISGLQIWYDAYQIVGKSTGDEISTWTDSSGNGRDATGVVSNTLKPTYRATDGPNSRPAVRMVRSDNSQGGYFSIADLSGTGWTAGHGFVVAIIDADPTGSISVSAPPIAQWGRDTDEYYPAPTGDGLAGHVLAGMGSTSRFDTGDPTTSLATWLVHEQRTASGAYSARINGATSGGDFYSNASNTVEWNGSPRLGFTGTNSKIMRGLIAEVIFYNRVLSGGEVTTIYDYLETKYAITLP